VYREVDIVITLFKLELSTTADKTFEVSCTKQRKTTDANLRGSRVPLELLCFFTSQHHYQQQHTTHQDA
jgi:hypothetical protein